MRCCNNAGKYRAMTDQASPPKPVRDVNAMLRALMGPQLKGHVVRDVNLLLHTFARAGMLVQCNPDSMERHADYIEAMQALLSVKIDIVNIIERSSGIMDRIQKSRVKRSRREAQGQLDLLDDISHNQLVSELDTLLKPKA